MYLFQRNPHVRTYVRTYVHNCSPQSLLAGVKLLKQFQVELGTLEKERQELCNAEKLFDLPITAYPGLVEVDREVGQFSKVLDLYEAQRVRMLTRASAVGDYVCQLS